MNIQVVARSDEVKRRHKDRVQAKLEKLPRYFEHIHSIEAVLQIAPHEATAEVIVAAGRDQTFVAKESVVKESKHKQGGEDHLMAAIDLAVHKVEAQIKKYKERLRDHRGRKGSADEQLPPEETYEDIIEKSY